MSVADRVRTEATLPRTNGELVFAAPWEARAFAVAVGLAETGACAWEDFRSRLIAEIGRWEQAHGEGGDADWSYYRRWLAALERLLVEDGIATAQELDDRAARIARAAAHEHDHDRD